MSKLQISDPRYNAAEEAFEAIVTLVTDDYTVRLATRFAAPLNTDDETVEHGLLAEAGRMLAAGSGLRSRMVVDAPRPVGLAA